MFVIPCQSWHPAMFLSSVMLVIARALIGWRSALTVRIKVLPDVDELRRGELR